MTLIDRDIKLNVRSYRGRSVGRLTSDMQFLRDGLDGAYYLPSVGTYL